jgi:hypothetical protein
VAEMSYSTVLSVPAVVQSGLVSVGLRITRYANAACCNPYTSNVVTYDIVEYYVGNNFIPNEENIMTNNYDKCMIVYL